MQIYPATMPVYIIHSEDGQTLYEGDDKDKALEKSEDSKGEVHWRRYTLMEDGQVELMSINYYNGKSQGTFSRQVLCRRDAKTLVDMIIDSNHH